MKYSKPVRSFDEQVDLLLQRGMVGDRDRMRRRLSAVSYYRLSGYWFHRKRSDDSFEPGTHFDVAWEQYMFDRKLRVLLMDAIERIEVGVRTQFSYHHGLAHGPFGYATDPAALPKLWPAQRIRLFDQLAKEIERSKERFVNHFRQKYGDTYPPADLDGNGGDELRLRAQPLAGIDKVVKNEVARAFAVSDEVLQSWFWTLNEVRNICAHHGRLWNRDLGNKPAIPRAKHHPSWHEPVPTPNHRVYAALTICAHCLACLAPSSTWQARVRKLLDTYPDVPIKNMGFPDEWLKCPIWQGAASAT